jgi:hypothetical protein
MFFYESHICLLVASAYNPIFYFRFIFLFIQCIFFGTSQT